MDETVAPPQPITSRLSAHSSRLHNASNKVRDDVELHTVLQNAGRLMYEAQNELLLSNRRAFAARRGMELGLAGIIAIDAEHVPSGTRLVIVTDLLKDSDGHLLCDPGSYCAYRDGFNIMPTRIGTCVRIDGDVPPDVLAWPSLAFDLFKRPKREPWGGPVVALGVLTRSSSDEHRLALESIWVAG